MDETKYGLLVAFDRDDPEFTAGFEVGVWWERLKASSEEIIRDATVHTSNEEMMRRLAQTTGFDVFLERAPVEGWSYATFYRKRPVAAA